MPLTSRGAPDPADDGTRPPAASQGGYMAGSARPAEPAYADELERNLSGSLQRRRRLGRVLVIVFVGLPAAIMLSRHGFTGRAVFLVPATVAYMVLIDRVVALGPSAWSRRWTWLALPVIVGLAAATFAVGGMSWLGGFAIATASTGRLAPSRRLMAASVTCCAGIGLGIGLWRHLSYSNLLSVAVVPALAGLLAFSAERRNALMHRLTETRAELARMAVAEERLRIARDLHDLLGHSLSLIALKAELAGRVIGADPSRAAKEIAELEKVARQSLTEVRQAVTSYRQPGLAAELAAARRMLSSAGIDCRVQAPSAYSLEPPVDALLAWTVREGATNIVRHSGARRADITIDVTGTHATVTLADDGTGPVAGPDAGGAPGSGLAGLAERAASLRGMLSAGAPDGGGFRLVVTVPLPREGTASGAPAAGPSGERVGS